MMLLSGGAYFEELICQTLVLLTNLLHNDIPFIENH